MPWHKKKNYLGLGSLGFLLTGHGWSTETLACIPDLCLLQLVSSGYGCTLFMPWPCKDRVYLRGFGFDSMVHCYDANGSSRPIWRIWQSHDAYDVRNFDPPDRCTRSLRSHQQVVPGKHRTMAAWHWQCRRNTSVLPVVILWLTRGLKISPFVLPKQIQHHLSSDCLTSYNLQLWNLLKRISDHETSWKKQCVISVSQAEFQPQAWLSECIPPGIMSPATTGTQALANIMWATATLKKENAPRSKVSDSKRLWWVLTRSISKFIRFTKLETTWTCHHMSDCHSSYSLIHWSLMVHFHHFHPFSPFEDALIRHAAFIAVWTSSHFFGGFFRMDSFGFDEAKLLDAGVDFRPHEYSTMVCLGCLDQTSQQSTRKNIRNVMLILRWLWSFLGSPVQIHDVQLWCRSKLAVDISEARSRWSMVITQAREDCLFSRVSGTDGTDSQ